MEENNVRTDMCQERHKNLESVILRDEERLRKYEETQQQLSNVSIQLSEILKAQTRQLEVHENSIESLKQKPNLWFDRILTWVGSGVVMGVISYIFYSLNMGS